MSNQARMHYRRDPFDHGERVKEPGPDHPITVTPYSSRVVVRFAGAVVADTTDALDLREASYKPVIYIPRGDAVLSHSERSDRQTHCPYKGDASYFHLVADGKRAENAVWTYEAPFPAMKAIASYIAFYPDKVSITHT
jgi:uncharacterized protein (DUF427 family)